MVTLVNLDTEDTRDVCWVNDRILQHRVIWSDGEDLDIRVRMGTGDLEL